MHRYEITIYRVGGLAEWQRHTDLAGAMDWYAWELVNADRVPVQALIRELCEGCSIWYDLGSHKCGGKLDLAANDGLGGLTCIIGCEDSGHYGVHCDGLPVQATWQDRDGYEWTRTLCSAHSAQFAWEQEHARDI